MKLPTHALLFALGAILSVDALADRLPLPGDTPAAYRNECGSCHLAYPPALMSSAGWQRTMAMVDRHFGTDASLSRPEHQAISRFLDNNAGSQHRLGDAGEPPRISNTAWFQQEHRKVPAPLWRDPRVKTPANCEGCHAHAAEGSYRGREIALPELKKRKD